jgi:hypothetical protein
MEPSGQEDEDAALTPRELELDMLRRVLQRLDVRDACAVASTCRAWRAVTSEIWRPMAEKRWKHWSSPRWQELQAKGSWQAIYSGRHAIDKAAEVALREMAWPMKREVSK